MADKTKCEHELCSCMLDEDEEYCSPQCTAADDLDAVALECECGHATCRSSMTQTA